MARIAGVDLPRHKQVAYALPYLYGVGHALARENCTRAREALHTMQSGRVTRFDSKGERVFLDETQLAQETARAQREVQQWCS